MAEDDMPDFDDSFDGALDWIYIEDDFPLADELAEQQIPDPGYAGTRFEIEMMEMDDFDLYDYWEDLAYGDDVYWDHGGTKAQETALGQKRKRQSANTLSTNNEKRRKVSLKETSGNNVLFISMSTRLERAWAKPAFLKTGQPFALLPDWRVRFSDHDEVTTETEMPAAMKKAAEAQEEDTPDSFRHYNAAPVADEDDEWEDEEEGDGQELPSELTRMDPEVLKGFLRQRMSDMGLGNMDEAAFMDTMMKMLSGEEGADDATAALANDILGQATEGKDEALSGWLSKQGVSIDEAEEDDEDSESVAAAGLPDKPSRKALHAPQGSPPDSAIDIAKSSQSTATQMPIHGSSPLASGRKRTAPKNVEKPDLAKKRKVTMSPAANSFVSTSASQQGSVLEEQEAAQAASNGTETEDILVSHPTVDEQKKATMSTTRAENATAVRQNQTTSSKQSKFNKPDSKKATEGEAEDEDSIEVAPAPAKATRNRTGQAKAGDAEENITISPHSKPTSSQKGEVEVANTKDHAAGVNGEEDNIDVAPAKSTRKRKAQRDTEIEKSAPKQKKQAKKTSAAPVEPAGTRARSTRAAARAGK